MAFRASVRVGQLCRVLLRCVWPLAATAIVVAGCAPSDAPPTSPLDDGASATSATASVLPTFTPSPDTPTQPTVSPSGTPATSAAAEAERITGGAIARLAEWLGVPETDLRLTRIEAVDWPDACLGVANPALACAEVITPGYRVTLHHVSQPETSFFVHASKGDRYEWAPSHGPERRVIESVDAESGTVTLRRADGDEPMGRIHRLVPGSFLDAALGDLEAGQLVAIGTADPVDGGDAGLIVLLVPVAG